jgi:hypothetical protein
MAWGAESLRGNEANENELMVTRPQPDAQGAKWARFCTGGHGSPIPPGPHHTRPHSRAIYFLVVVIAKKIIVIAKKAPGVCRALIRFSFLLRGYG